VRAPIREDVTKDVTVSEEKSNEADDEEDDNDDVDSINGRHHRQTIPMCTVWKTSPHPVRGRTSFLV